MDLAGEERALYDRLKLKYQGQVAGGGPRGPLPPQVTRTLDWDWAALSACCAAAVAVPVAGHAANWEGGERARAPPRPRRTRLASKCGHGWMQSPTTSPHHHACEVCIRVHKGGPPLCLAGRLHTLVRLHVQTHTLMALQMPTLPLPPWMLHPARQVDPKAWARTSTFASAQRATAPAYRWSCTTTAD